MECRTESLFHELQLNGQEDWTIPMAGKTTFTFFFNQ